MNAKWQGDAWVLGAHDLQRFAVTNAIDFSPSNVNQEIGIEIFLYFFVFLMIQ